MNATQKAAKRLREANRIFEQGCSIADPEDDSYFGEPEDCGECAAAYVKAVSGIMGSYAVDALAEHRGNDHD